MAQGRKDSSIVRDKDGRPFAEERSWIYYDSQQLTVAGGALAAGTRHTLFAVAQGQAGNGFVAAKTYSETNMLQASQLPANHRFTVKSISLEIVPQVTAAPIWPTYADVASLIYRSNFAINVVNKEMLRVPTSTVSGGSAVYNSGLTAAGVNLVSNGWPHASNRLFLDIPIILEAVANFSVVLETTTVWAAAPSVQFSYRVNLWGILERPAQ
jgi:hypothetical protein